MNMQPSSQIQWKGDEAVRFLPIVEFVMTARFCQRPLRSETKTEGAS